MLELEKEYYSKDVTAIVGVDEAGRGPAAGGVFASCVYFDKISKGLVKDLDKLNITKL